MMGFEANKAVARSFFIDLINEKRHERIPEIFTPDIVLNGELGGYEGVRRWMDLFHDSFPDCRDTITGQWAEGDEVVTRIRFEATHTGPWMGAAPTGRRVAWPGIAVHRIEAGRIARMDTVIQLTETLKDLGWLKPGG